MNICLSLDLYKDIRVCFVMAKLTTEAFYIDFTENVTKKEKENSVSFCHISYVSDFHNRDSFWTETYILGRFTKDLIIII